MRFYKTTEAEMLHAVSILLQKQQKSIAAKVPALKDLINKFVAMEKELYALRIGLPGTVALETLEKISVKDAFAEVTLKLLAVLKAANYGFKNKKEKPIHYTLWALKKLPASVLSEVYIEVMKRLKKIKNLQYYGFSPVDMRDAQAYYKEFKAKKNTPLLRKKEVAAKNKRLNDGVKEGVDMLKNAIDPLMMLATEGDHRLAMDYKATRKVLARAQGRPSDKEAAYRKSRGQKAGLTERD